ncbi:macro domain-containing protein [Catellatospora sp. NPDC049111]|uniref:macro domain-containing protein n=1 Tax=Catellatospora sp. NPDC049111 TaxID=3155271 RepID=UPI00340E899C
MAQVHISVLGRLVVTVDDRPVGLAPLTARLLLRLVAAESRPVPVEKLYRDVWAAGAGAPVGRSERTSVQKRIAELRRVLDPHRPGDCSTVIPHDRGATFAYRLALEPSSVDFWQVLELSRRTAEDPATAADSATRGLALWAGEPFEDIAGDRFAQDARRRCAQLRRGLKHALLNTHLDRDTVAADRLAQELLAEDPADEIARAAMAHLQARLAAQTTLLDHRVTRAHVTIAVVVGDLFAWPADNLVVGFSDTFDTDTRDEIIISRNSAQGQLLHRTFGGDLARLDRELEQALGDREPDKVEPSEDRPRGKRRRYPVGTVAVLGERDRSIFCVAYSRLGNDLVARSSLPQLEHSLGQLWQAAYLHGQFRDVTMPLVGSGLSRIQEADHMDLLRLIMKTFLRAARLQPVCRRLRVVVTPSQAHQIDVLRLHHALYELSQEDR